MKYPHLFHECGAVVLTKKDLFPHVRFDRELFWSDVESLNAKAAKFEVDSLSGDGIEAWIGQVEKWLIMKRQS